MVRFIEQKPKKKKAAPKPKPPKVNFITESTDKDTPVKSNQKIKVEKCYYEPFKKYEGMNGIIEVKIGNALYVKMDCGDRIILDKIHDVITTI